MQTHVSDHDRGSLRGGCGGSRGSDVAPLRRLRQHGVSGEPHGEHESTRPREHLGGDLQVTVTRPRQG